jgi:hypothetical protein
MKVFLNPGHDRDYTPVLLIRIMALVSVMSLTVSVSVSKVILRQLAFR